VEVDLKVPVQYLTTLSTTYVCLSHHPPTPLFIRPRFPPFPPPPPPPSLFLLLLPPSLLPLTLLTRQPLVLPIPFSTCSLLPTFSPLSTPPFAFLTFSQGSERRERGEEKKRRREEEKKRRREEEKKRRREEEKKRRREEEKKKEENIKKKRREKARGKK